MDISEFGAERTRLTLHYPRHENMSLWLIDLRGCNPPDWEHDSSEGSTIWPDSNRRKCRKEEHDDNRKNQGKLFQLIEHVWVSSVCYVENMMQGERNRRKAKYCKISEVVGKPNRNGQESLESKEEECDWSLTCEGSRPSFQKDIPCPIWKVWDRGSANGVSWTESMRQNSEESITYETSELRGTRVTRFRAMQRIVAWIK